MKRLLVVAMAAALIVAAPATAAKDAGVKPC